MQQATVKQVMETLRVDGETLKSFTDGWKALPEADKLQLKVGIGDGTMTY